MRPVGWWKDKPRIWTMGMLLALRPVVYAITFLALPAQATAGIDYREVRRVPGHVATWALAFGVLGLLALVGLVYRRALGMGAHAFLLLGAVDFLYAYCILYAAIHLNHGTGVPASELYLFNAAGTWTFALICYKRLHRLGPTR